MEKINVMSIPLYKFSADKNLMENVHEEVTELQFIPEPDPSQGGYVCEDYYNEKLFQWFNECVKEVANLYFLDSISFPIVDCWANKYTALNRLQRHKHPNSVICGVYYVTDHDSGSTIFEHPNPWSWHLPEDSKFNLAMEKRMHTPEANLLQGETKPTAGTLILFPGSLFHYMKTFKDTKKVKYSVAFNTFPSGVISDFKSIKLEINTVSLEEKYKSGRIK
jgi:hypothetical protein